MRRRELDITTALIAAEDDAPEDYKCPLSGQIMRDPVIVPGGQTFERNWIVAEIARSGLNPLTRTPLRVQELIPNLALKSRIESYCTENRLTLSAAPPVPLAVRVSVPSRSVRSGHASAPRETENNVHTPLVREAEDVNMPPAGQAGEDECVERCTPWVKTGAVAVAMGGGLVGIIVLFMHVGAHEKDSDPQFNISRLEGNFSHPYRAATSLSAEAASASTIGSWVTMRVASAALLAMFGLLFSPQVKRQVTRCRETLFSATPVAGNGIDFDDVTVQVTA